MHWKFIVLLVALVDSQLCPDLPQIEDPDHQYHFVCNPKNSIISNPQENVPKINRPRPVSATQFTKQTTPLPIQQPAPQISEHNPHERFSTKLFNVVGPKNLQKNIIYSPISLQTLLGLISIGAQDVTLQEMQKVLELPSTGKEVARLFQKVIATQQLQKSSDTRLIMANKMYYSASLRLTSNISELARTYFDSELEHINFNVPIEAARKINEWVADKTNHHIADLVSPYSLDAETKAILVNAIYFKAKWQTEFSYLDTLPQDFHVYPQGRVSVDMMYNDDDFLYGEFPHLQAKVIELPYKDSPLSMMIVLPDQTYGLENVERRLSDVDLNALAKNLTMATVTVRLPKFKINFDIDMVQPLRELGINRLFSDHAQLAFFDQQDVGISKVQHKAYIEVNEAGSEAAAASFSKFIPLSLPPKIISFTCDHPFMFAIRSPKAVYFIGHVVN